MNLWLRIKWFFRRRNDSRLASCVAIFRSLKITKERTYTVRLVHYVVEEGIMSQDAAIKIYSWVIR